MQPSLPPNLRKAHSAAIPSCCAATFESATAPFISPGSSRNGLNAGSCSSGVISNCFAASSYAALRTFHIYGEILVRSFARDMRGLVGCTLCWNRSGSGSEVKSSSCSAMLVAFALDGGILWCFPRPVTRPVSLRRGRAICFSMLKSREIWMAV